jgi:hypothetical protein
MKNYWAEDAQARRYKVVLYIVLLVTLIVSMYHGVRVLAAS